MVCAPGRLTINSLQTQRKQDTATIKGGTGRFAGATGGFIAERVVDTAAGTTTGSFEGTISRGCGAAA
jgi:hypothetical protein